MKTWFMNLALREKQVVVFGGLLLSLFCIYAGIFAPLASSVATLRTKVVSDTNLLNFMRDTNKKIQTLQKSSDTSSGPMTGSLLSTLQSNLNDTPFGKNVTQLQQSENDSVEVKIQNIPFDDFAKWLIEFTQQNQLTILQFTAAPNKEVGMVNVDLKIT